MQTEQTIEPISQAPRGSGSAPATQFAVSGMTCGNCARHVTEAIQGVSGVRSASVNLDAQQATVRWSDSNARNVEAVIKAVEAEGFGAKLLEAEGHEHEGHKLAGWQLNLWVGVLGTLPLMAGEWVFGWSLQPWFRWFSFAAASVVQVLAGARFYRGAWSQLKVRSSNMDTLVALGSTTAFAYSTWALFSGHGGHLYFMEAAAIITLISVGHWIESRVSVRASSALRNLLNLAPPVARRRKADGSETEVAVNELGQGDLVGLRPGDRVPTDGQVVEGASAMDESMLTGESTPIDKSAGTKVYAGTVNLNGRLTVRVTATGEETALAQIIQAVQRAQNSRANIQRLGDRVSSVFVPIVVLVALTAGLWWGLAPGSAQSVHDWLSRLVGVTLSMPTSMGVATGFIIAAAVLIVACPCAMGLATPAAIMAGSNAAAQRGILIRDGVALEKAGTVTAVMFDKTGTLTVGKPEVAKIWEQGPGGNPKTEGRNPKEGREPKSETGTTAALESAVARLAAGLAAHSGHPISQTIAKLSSEVVEVTDWKEVHGAGVQGNLRAPLAGMNSAVTGLARLGSLRWLKESEVDVSAGQAFIQEWSAQGATVIGLAIGKTLLGLFAVRDTLKSGAREVVAELGRQGLTTYLVTGDNPVTARSIAAQAGIEPERVFSEVRPEEKAGLVKKLQQEGKRVAFVGDGINDAPALEQADLGIAVSRASDIAREAADIILLKSEIEAVPESLGLARATLRTIKQNLFWAFFYNAVGIPLAALGFMSPILCAAAMGLSDVVVIGNALRLRRWRFKA